MWSAGWSYVDLSKTGAHVQDTRARIDSAASLRFKARVFGGVACSLENLSCLPWHTLPPLARELRVVSQHFGATRLPQDLAHTHSGATMLYGDRSLEILWTSCTRQELLQELRWTFFLGTYVACKRGLTEFLVSPTLIISRTIQSPPNARARLPSAARKLVRGLITAGVDVSTHASAGLWATDQLF